MTALLLIPTETLDKLMYHGFVFAMCLVLALVFSFVDLIDALRTARQVGERIRSKKIRHTMGKAMYYWAFIVCAFLIDLLFDLTSWWALPYITMVVTAIVGIIEMHSLMEHARKRKDNASKIEDVLSAIVKTATKEEAQRLLPKILDIVNTLNNK